MEELNPQNAFGELLLDALEAQYGSLDEGIAALIQSTGLEEDEVIAIVQGEVIVEDETLLSSILEAFPEADDEDMELLISTATAVDEEDRNSLIQAIGDTEEDMEEGEMPEEMPEEASYGRNHQGVAQFSQQVQNLEYKLANFERTANFSQALKELEVEASRYVDAELLPPSYKALLIGNFTDDGQRVACFSTVASENGVAPEVMLFATRYALGLLKDAAEFVEFRDFSVSDEEFAMAQFSAGHQEQAQGDLSAIFGDY